MSKLKIDDNSAPIQVLQPFNTQKIAISGTAASTTAPASGVGVLRLCPTIDCFYSIIGTATTSSVFLPAQTVEFIAIPSGQTVSTITDGSTGSIFVTSMI